MPTPDYAAAMHDPPSIMTRRWTNPSSPAASPTSGSSIRTSSRAAGAATLGLRGPFITKFPFFGRRDVLAEPSPAIWVDLNFVPTAQPTGVGGQPAAASASSIVPAR